MSDSLAVHQYILSRNPRRVAIIGGGYIGVEMADALIHRGLAVTLVERSGTVLKTVEPTLGRIVGDELNRHGVEVTNGVMITTISPEAHSLVISGTNGFHTEADMVLVSAGVQPATELARTAGVLTGLHGAVKVSRTTATNVPDIYAAGDCAETWHRILHEYVYLPLGSTAHKQGRIAGENAIGQHREFAGSLGTQVVKVFDLAVARTGLLEAEARQAGFKARTVELNAWDHKVYYPNAHQLTIRLTGDDETGRLLGAQMVGHWQGEVAKRIDIYASAIFHGMSIDALNDLDLSYTPRLVPPGTQCSLVRNPGN
jgi:NADPH-dependent 2,4-dienoyl-CoA reductase/sulfur reductase-like enzyme